MYRENAERDRSAREAGGIQAFLAKMELKIDIDRPAEDEWSRVAQLTQKTNQFNFTTVRRDEAQIRQLGDRECLRVKVADRFGDYGLVGVMIFSNQGDAIEVDTFLLSCRVLARGVEHAMMARLGKLALERGRSRVDALLIPTAKNEPAANFLESVGSDYRETVEKGTAYRFPAELSAGLVYDGSSPSKGQELSPPEPSEPLRSPVSTRDRSATYTRIATLLRDPKAVIAEVERRSERRRPDLETTFEPPRTALERDLANLWARILGLDRVGIFDDFTSLGGTSLKAANLFVEIDEKFGRKLSMATILDAPTVATLAPIVAGSTRRLREVRYVSSSRDRPGSLLSSSCTMATVKRCFTPISPAGYPKKLRFMGSNPGAMFVFPSPTHAFPKWRLTTSSRSARFNPRGPISSVGCGARGTIAFELALQLEAAGETVGFVALLDSAAPMVQAKVGREIEQRRERFRKALQEEPAGRSKVRCVFGKLARASKKVKGFTAYQVSTRTKALTIGLKFRRCVGARRGKARAGIRERIVGASRLRTGRMGVCSRSFDSMPRLFCFVLRKARVLIHRSSRSMKARCSAGSAG